MIIPQNPYAPPHTHILSTPPGSHRLTASLTAPTAAWVGRLPLLPAPLVDAAPVANVAATAVAAAARPRLIGAAAAATTTTAVMAAVALAAVVSAVSGAERRAPRRPRVWVGYAPPPPRRRPAAVTAGLASPPAAAAAAAFRGRRTALAQPRERRGVGAGRPVGKGHARPNAPVPEAAAAVRRPVIAVVVAAATTATATAAAAGCCCCCCCCCCCVEVRCGRGLERDEDAALGFEARRQHVPQRQVLSLIPTGAGVAG